MKEHGDFKSAVEKLLSACTEAPNNPRILMNAVWVILKYCDQAGPDEALIVAAQAGDLDSLTALVAGSHPNVRRFAHSLCASREDAEDARIVGHLDGASLFAQGAVKRFEEALRAGASTSGSNESIIADQIRRK